MRVYIVIASTNELSNIAQFNSQLTENDHEIKLIVIDEGDDTLRSRNRRLLQGLHHKFFGPKERSLWFLTRFNDGYEKYLSVIPKKCHAETSFGFLVAYEEDANLIIEVDDDVFPADSQNIVNLHWKNLTDEFGMSVVSDGKWYNTIENLELNAKAKLFPRGHPYVSGARLEKYLWADEGGKCALNMGLWAGCPDLDALTLLIYGGLNGRCSIKSRAIKRDKVIVKEGTYFAISSMNTGFVTEIVPAFYQLFVNHMGVGRFDDVWSGIFLKKVLDHLGERICLGAPLVFHDKRPRDTFMDLKSELDGMAINERLWKLVNKVHLTGKTYWDAYSSLIDELKINIAKWFDNVTHQKFLGTQLAKMELWLEIIDKLR